MAWPITRAKSPKRKKRKGSYVPGHVVSTQEEALERIHQFLTDPRNRLTKLYDIRPALEEALAGARTQSSVIQLTFVLASGSQHEPAFSSRVRRFTLESEPGHNGCGRRDS